MSSTGSISSEPPAEGAGRGPSPGSVAQVAVTLALLAALVWWLHPSQPNFTPAPLDPQPQECLKVPREFVPTNITDLSGGELDALPVARKNHAVFRMNMQPCTCGCNLSVADCRVSSPSCKVSPQLAKKLIEEERAATQARPEVPRGRAKGPSAVKH